MPRARTPSARTPSARTPSARRPLRPVQVLLVVAVVVAAIVVGSRLDGAPSDRPSTGRAPAAPAYPTVIDRLNGRITAENQGLSRCVVNDPGLRTCGPAPELRGITRWFNTATGRLQLDSLQGRVVLLELFSYACGSCRQDLGDLSRLAARYGSSGLRVIGLQSPQWDFERDPDNLAAALRRLAIDYPVGLDADEATYRAYRSTTRPARYLIDASGTVRAIGFGPGGRARTESQLRRLLWQSRPGQELPPSTLTRSREGASTREIHLGSGGGDPDYTGGPRLMVGRATRYAFAARLSRGQFTLDGAWTSTREHLDAGADARVRLRLPAGPASVVVAGSGTLQVHLPGRPIRRVPVDDPPGLVPLVTVRRGLPTTVTVEVTRGVRLYAVDTG